MTNNKFFFLYTQACYSGNFTVNDSVLENMVNAKPDVGAFAVIGNSQMGLYSYTNTDLENVNNWLHKSFAAAVFEGERIGEALQMAKMDVFMEFGKDKEYRRREAFMTNLLGCPFTDLLADPVPAAYFDADKKETAGLAPFTVNFTDKSTPLDITSWTWDFGDGTGSNEQNPTHTYLLSGCYTVSLTITTAGGETYTETKDRFIEVTAETIPVDMTGKINIRKNQENSDSAWFVMTGINDPDLATIESSPLRFQFGTAGEEPAYSLVLDSSDLDIVPDKRVYYRNSKVKILCRFHKDKCLVKLKDSDISEELLSEDMTVDFEIGGKKLTNTSGWEKKDRKNWIKYWKK